MSNATETGTLDRLRAFFNRTADDSRVVALVRHASSTVADSGVRRLLEQVHDYTRDAFIYRWLTKEPDPEIVVIDLRETYTVGPIIEFIDRLIEHVDSVENRIAPYWYESMTNRCFDWTFLQLRRAADTRTGHTLLAFLEPPEPPDQDDEGNGQN